VSEGPFSKTNPTIGTKNPKVASVFQNLRLGLEKTWVYNMHQLDESSSGSIVDHCGYLPEFGTKTSKKRDFADS